MIISPHGKIESYHGVLKRWFVKELRHQPVLDLRHLQELLDAVIDQAYHEHRHRELKCSPREAFGECISQRLVTIERLREAFMDRKTLTVNPRTGNVRVGSILFRLPRSLRSRQRAEIYVDPEEPGRAYHQASPGVFVPLEPAIKKADSPDQLRMEFQDREEPAGSLTPLLERYRGRELPLARPGFGLPEIYQMFAVVLGRRIPSTEAESASILDWLNRNGPFDPPAFRHALVKAVERLGEGHPLSRILREIERQIQRREDEKE